MYRRKHVSLISNKNLGTERFVLVKTSYFHNSLVLPFALIRFKLLFKKTKFLLVICLISLVFTCFLCFFPSNFKVACLYSHKITCRREVEVYGVVEGINGEKNLSVLIALLRLISNCNFLRSIF